MVSLVPLVVEDEPLALCLGKGKSMYWAIDFEIKANKVWRMRNIWFRTYQENIINMTLNNCLR